jgi:transcriptional regulator with XRE-family HTH domain
MAYKIDFSIASSTQIESVLCKQLENIRLTQNLTQVEVAREAGVSLRTITRLEDGQGVSLDTFIRVMRVLGLMTNLQALLPDPAIRPVERLKIKGKERKRARPQHGKQTQSGWVWGDERKSTL